MTAPLEVSEEQQWSAQESALFGDRLLDNCGHYAPYSTRRTRLTLAKVRRGGELVGIAPLLRLVKYRGTRLLEARSRRWLDPLLGPFARKTTCLVDASFMAFRHASPFFARGTASEAEVRAAVVAHLQAARDLDSVLISEPATDGAWARANGFLPFLQLPLVAVELAGCASFEEYLAGLGQKRRRNARKERQLFEDKGGTIELHRAPVEAELAGELHACLVSSSERNRGLMEIPFEDLMNCEPAFRSQRQGLLVARVGGALAGFFAFLESGQTMAQCHGGLDYEHSLEVKAYPNLIHAATEHAIASGFQRLTLGPLNNEAKRRAGTLLPVMASYWVRDRATRFLSERFLVRRFQVYGGEVG